MNEPTNDNIFILVTDLRRLIDEAVKAERERLIAVAEDIDEDRVTYGHSRYAQLGDAGATKHSIIEAMRSSVEPVEGGAS